MAEMKYFPIRRKWMWIILALTLTLLWTGCDSNDAPTGPGDPEVTQRIDGRVTDDAGFSKHAGAIEGAVVTAARVTVDGSLQPLAGADSTDAQGRYSLEVEETTEVMVLTAEKDAFTSRVLVYNNLDSEETVQAMPMTAESTAEADVYEAVKGDEEEGATLADVAAFVTSRVAAEIEAGNTTAAEVAAALQAKAQAEAQYLEEQDVSEEDVEAMEREEWRAFVTLQTDLYTAGDAEAEAVQTFEAAFVNAYAEADISTAARAHASKAGEVALLEFYAEDDAQARFALHQQAALLTSVATAHAIEAEFEAAGASQDQLDALAQARVTLLADLRNASSEDDIASARATYASSVEAELSAAIGVDATVLTTAKTALESIKASLQAAVDTAADANAVATAHVEYYTDAEATATSALETGSSNASLGGRVLAFLSAH